MKKEMTKQEKRKFILKISGLVLLGALTILSFVFSGQLYGENSVFNDNVSSNVFVNTLFQKIPSVIQSVVVITIAILVAVIVRWFMRRGFAKTNRSITIMKMFESFIKWIIAIIAILLVLGAWGVDTGTLLASAGILTLVIGLGAQSLVADIVAGMFMVFEGEFQVGDIVIINDWRGTVQEIGIRTTKIIDAGGNVNIVNNSQITTVINQTQDVSLAKCTVGIEYGESLPRVELVIRDNLEKIKQNIPGIIDGPFYKGVSALNTSSVDLLFLANCKEEDIFQVQRDMNREIKILFDDNGINIPFPQVVLNQPPVFDKKTTKRMEKNADAFVQDQKIQSKNMEEKAD